MQALKRIIGAGAAAAACALAAPAAAQGPQEGPPAGSYEFVPGESDRIEEAIDRAVSHMNFLIRGIARRRLRGANEPIDRIEIRYPGDSVWISLRAGDPPIVSPRDGSFAEYRRADGELLKVRTELSTGVVEQYFASDDGDKRMVYRTRPDGLLALEVEVLSERLKEPFTYTWIFRPVDDAGGGTGAGSRVGAGRPVHTYSIVARDPGTGQMGVAVQSHWFSVGPLVPWAEPGVGAVATQSFVDVSYGPLGLELLKAGKTAQQALAALVHADEHPEVRQVAIVDAAGNVAAHTGEGAIRGAGHRTGANYSVQANLMLTETVPDAMARAFEGARGDLTERLLAALEAAQAEGGDIRGKQSAAILVVSGERMPQPWQGRLFDLRVEDHPEPVAELRRLVTLARAYARMNAGDEALTTGDVEAALREYSAANAMVPDAASNGEMAFWHAVTLASLDRVEEALPLFRRAFAQDPNWRELIPRLVEAGQLPDDPALVRRITGAR